MKKIALVWMFFVPLALLWSGSVVEPSLVWAQSVKEKTLSHEGTTISVRMIGKADILEVKPYIKAKKGKKKGRLWLDVVLQNKASKASQFQIFGQGKVGDGGWLGGSVKAPKKGKIDPGKKITVKIKTRFKGAQIPEQIRVEVF